MNKISFLAISLAVIIIVGWLFQTNQLKTIKSIIGSDVTEEIVVTLTVDGYEPASPVVTKGTTVRFVSITGKPHWPASNLHPTHEQYSDFDPKRPLEPTEEWSFVFNKVGQWDFHDHIRAYYTGTIQVVD